jgi:hypothetical protein
MASAAVRRTSRNSDAARGDFFRAVTTTIVGFLSAVASWSQSMIPKSGNRFSDKIILDQKVKARV